MLAAHSSHQQHLGHRGAPAALVQVALDPFTAICILLISVAIFGEQFGGPYLILALIVFSLTFPSRLPGQVDILGLARNVLANWFAVVGLLIAIGWVTRTLDAFDSRVIYTWVLATPVALFVAHLLVPVTLPRLLAAEGMHRVAVIVGGGKLGRKLFEQIQGSPLSGIRIVGYFEDRSLGRIGKLDSGEFLGSLSQLAGYAKTHRVDLIYITLPVMASQPRIRRLLEELHDTTASVYFIPDILSFDLIQARLDTIGDIPIIAVCETPFYGFNGLVKRASDLALALIILALISPLMIAIAFGVRLSSPGPVLFRQRRYGLDGREIVIYKFRSMTVNEDGNVIRQAAREDQRVTRFGAFLRKYSLDELPQFINVIQGRMSVVGPRPHAVAHNEMYRKVIRGYMIRHKVKPGITGWAQVNGLRGETELIEKMQARIEYDLDYLRHWSLWFDLRIIMKTVCVIFKDQNAY